ncbi:AhpC/TSA family protein [Segetibacter sp. 3557_3]|uniref:TlpA disulfide reductase family protein n=1 Tax=Segetibacter sp. 3557_3 TaxID=2547429 RepID=UPI0010584F82|nr:TlpA disulfide reductase family protein [Segetibacter sp. 3557_3]TDH27854.1 AhpC/TSA family protein [Segetibacter sp. 3557_3]
MKKLLLVLLFPVLAQAQKSSVASKAKQATAPKAQEGLILNGRVEGLPDSTMVLLSHPSNPNNMFAVGYAKKGAFTLKGQTPYPDLYLLSFTGIQKQVDLFLENKSITLTGNINDLENVKVSGSDVHTDYELYETRFNPIKNRLNEIANNIRVTGDAVKRDSLVAAFETERKILVTQVDAFVQEKPASPVTTFILLITSQVAGDGLALESRYNKLTAAARNTLYATQIESAIYEAKHPKPGAPGTMAVEFSQADTANKPVSLSSFKGKYVLVDFWASWCKPCRIENPAVVNAFNSFKDKNFTILSVSLDQSRENWLRAIKDDNLAWTHVSDLKYWQNEVAQLYGVSSIPTNMLIDPSGKIIARDLRGEQLYATLQKVLN